MSLHTQVDPRNADQCTPWPVYTLLKSWADGLMRLVEGIAVVILCWFGYQAILRLISSDRVRRYQYRKQRKVTMDLKGQHLLLGMTLAEMDKVVLLDKFANIQAWRRSRTLIYHAVSFGYILNKHNLHTLVAQ